MEEMLVAAFCCFGVSVLMYSLSWSRESEAEIVSSVIPVKELKELGKLIGDKTSSLLVAVSGKVGSIEAFKCNRSGIWSVYLTETAKLVFKTKIEDGELKEESDKILSHHFSTVDKWKEESEETLVSHKIVPWFLEDDTGRVNVVGFGPYSYDHLKTYVFDEPVNELFRNVLQSKESRDKDGTLAITRTNEISSKYFQFFRDGKSIDKVVSDLKSNSTTLLNTAVFFQTVGRVLCAIYVVGLIWGAISKREAIDGNVAEPDIRCD